MNTPAIVRYRNLILPALLCWAILNVLTILVALALGQWFAVIIFGIVLALTVKGFRTVRAFKTVKRYRLVDLLNDCGARRQLLASHRAEDRYGPSGKIIAGEVKEIWSTCGRRRGHEGDHGPGSRIRRALRRLT